MPVRTARSVSQPESISEPSVNDAKIEGSNSLKNFAYASLGSNLDKVPDKTTNCTKEMNGTNFTLAHFDLLKVLGKGSFGKVSSTGHNTLVFLSQDICRFLERYLTFN